MLYIVRVGRKITAWDCDREEARQFAREDVVGVVEPQDDEEVDAWEKSLLGEPWIDFKPWYGSLYRRLGPSPTMVGFVKGFGLDHGGLEVTEKDDAYWASHGIELVDEKGA